MKIDDLINMYLVKLICTSSLRNPIQETQDQPTFDYYEIERIRRK